MSSGLRSNIVLFQNKKLDKALTSLGLALFSQSSLELLVIGQEDCIELTYFFSSSLKS
jgi:hypothetical protein